MGNEIDDTIYPYTPAAADPADVDSWSFDEVLDFAYDYLRRNALPPTDEQVRKVTLVLAQYTQRFMPIATLESLLLAAG